MLGEGDAESGEHHAGNYSPDLNPIEQVFAKLKTLLRNAAERSVEATWKRIGQLLTAFTPAECANYLANSRSYAEIWVTP